MTVIYRRALQNAAFDKLVKFPFSEVILTLSPPPTFRTQTAPFDDRSIEAKVDGRHLGVKAPSRESLRPRPPI